MNYTWYEVSPQDWDKLTEGVREIFIGKQGKLSFACRGDVVDDYKVKPIRKIKTD